MNLDLESIKQEIQRRGPARVIINGKGDAVSPEHARREFGIAPEVIFVRNDGWSLGAPRRFSDLALRMWQKDWVAVLHQPFDFVFPAFIIE